MNWIRVFTACCEEGVLHDASHPPSHGLWEEKEERERRKKREKREREIFLAKIPPCAFISNQPIQ